LVPTTRSELPLNPVDRRDNEAVDVDELPPAEELWWTAAVLAARDQARPASTADSTWRFDPRDLILHHEPPDGCFLHLQRLFGGRLSIWGTDPAETAPPTWSGIPGWAGSDVDEWWERSGATFLVWHSRHGWDTATPDASLVPLEPLLAAYADGLAAVAIDPEALTALVGDGDLGTARDVLSGARAEAPTKQGRVRRMLAREIRAQMSASAERDRLLPQRPVVVVRWARAARPPAGFSCSVHFDGQSIVEDSANHRLDEQFRRSLLNVFELLHHEDGDPESGAWLFARVTFDGVNVSFDRAFDSRPHWYLGDGPTLEVLAHEMSRRTPQWRPPWSRLL